MVLLPLMDDVLYNLQRQGRINFYVSPLCLITTCSRPTRTSKNNDPSLLSRREALCAIFQLLCQRILDACTIPPLALPSCIR